MAIASITAATSFGRSPLRQTDAFDAALAQYGAELHLFCYRLLASYDDAGDAVRETFVRAQRERNYARERSALRRRLYGIATDACLDRLRDDGRRMPAGTSIADLPWLQPYPDRLLDALVPLVSPDAVRLDRESIDLTFLGTLQLLAPRQRAVLVLRSVLGWSAAETAATLGMTVTAANSALQRARLALRERRAGQAPLPARTTEHERAAVDRWIALRKETDSVRRAVQGEWVRIPTDANRQPAVASYVRRAGAAEFTADSLDVLRVHGDHVSEVTTFGAHVFAAFDLPATLSTNRVAHG